jgi:hypothetical protein
VTHFLTLVLVNSAEPDPVARAVQAMERYWIDDLADRDTKPDARCDGFVVGGRYDGIIWGKEQHHNLKPDEFQRRYGLDVVQAADNVRPVSTLVPDLLPYAIVTPDDRWIGWERESSDRWPEVVRALLTRHSESVAVAIDCHC